MTIVRSLGVTTLVALMSAHRAVAEQRAAAGKPFAQATVEAITAYLCSAAETLDQRSSTEPPPSCN